MSERKVLNKYYPPDFDPSKIPRMKLPKNRQYTVRLMAPFNMRCATCGEYIYKGKKFNARKEDVENQDYLGIRIYRFYIKCTRCLQEISFKTDPRNTDYEIEAGATRNFMALKLAEELAQREEEELKEEEASNPMKLLENRTKQSKNEIELLESLEELKDLNKRQQAVDYDSMLLAYDTKMTQREREEKMQQMDEEYIKTVKFHFAQKRKVVLEEEIVEEESPSKIGKPSTVTGAEIDKPESSTSNSSNSKSESWNKSVGGFVKKGKMNGLVKLNKKSNEKGADIEKTLSSKQETDKVDVQKSKEESNQTLTSKATEEIGKPSGLSLLGAYSDSEED